MPGELDLDVISRTTPGGELVVRTKVTNLTGHKLPTGYPEGRRMWLQVQVQDALALRCIRGGLAVLVRKRALGHGHRGSG